MSSKWERLYHVSAAVSVCIHAVLLPYNNSLSSDWQLPLLFLTSPSVSKAPAVHMRLVLLTFALATYTCFLQVWLERMCFPPV